MGSDCMKIITLLENKSSKKELKSSHGLSLYIEHQGKKILFDLGPNRDFFSNAKKLNVNLKDVDYVIISHGHYDHATELSFFLNYNTKAKVFISKHAFEKHVGKVGIIVKDIGIRQVKDTNRLHYVTDTIQLDTGITVTPNVLFKQEVLSDERLFVKIDGEYIKDEFNHEIYLILSEDKKNVLVSGCSHKGISNIITTLETKHKITFDFVIGGFHFKRFNKGNQSHQQYLTNIGNEFKQMKTSFYACHCTGDDAFEYLDNVMDNLNPLHTGDVINI
jgi:7,8-dihydropterin-6-yl-methyl-4-(beta-D-ribofuranosyl)aminobenzene 5'-phosphate synthase